MTTPDRDGWMGPVSPVLVTGGSSGIGLGIAESLVRSGRQVAILGRDPARCATAAEHLASLSTQPDAASDCLLTLIGDTADEGFLHAAVAEVLEKWGRIDGLVTSAGRLARGSAVELDAAKFRAVLETNVIGTWLAIRATLPTMLANSYGRIVTIGSVLGTVGAAERSAYAATKGAVAALTRSIALEVADQGITVNCVAPGPVRTPLNTAPGTDPAPSKNDPGVQAHFTDGIPMGRWGTPADIASPVVTLLAPEAGWQTGSVVHVDGGYTAQ